MTTTTTQHAQHQATLKELQHTRQRLNQHHAALLALRQACSDPHHHHHTTLQQALDHADCALANHPPRYTTRQLPRQPYTHHTTWGVIDTTTSLHLRTHNGARTRAWSTRQAAQHQADRLNGYHTPDPPPRTTHAT